MGVADNRAFVHILVFIFPFAAAHASDRVLYKEQKSILVQSPTASSFLHGDKHLQVCMKDLAKILGLMHKIFSCYYGTKWHARLWVWHCSFSLSSCGGVQFPCNSTSTGPPHCAHHSRAVAARGWEWLSGDAISVAWWGSLQGTDAHLGFTFKSSEICSAVS